MVEQWTFNPLAVGSSPTCPTQWYSKPLIILLSQILQGIYIMKDIDAFNNQKLLNPKIIPKTLHKFGRFSYCVHNIIGHPIAEIFWVLGLERAGDYVHDITVPYPDTKD